MHPTKPRLRCSHKEHPRGTLLSASFPGILFPGIYSRFLLSAFCYMEYNRVKNNATRYGVSPKRMGWASVANEFISLLVLLTGATGSPQCWSRGFPLLDETPQLQLSVAAGWRTTDVAEGAAAYPYTGRFSTQEAVTALLVVCSPRPLHPLSGAFG